MFAALGYIKSQRRAWLHAAGVSIFFRWLSTAGPTALIVVLIYLGLFKQCGARDLLTVCIIDVAIGCALMLLGTLITSIDTQRSSGCDADSGHSVD